MTKAAANSSPRKSHSRLPASTWEQMKTAYASCLGLREIARNMGIPEGTVLARAKREGWTRQIVEAKAMVSPAAKQSNAITVTQSAAISMAERGQRHVEGMAGIVEKVVPYVASLEPGAVLADIDRVKKLDDVARRTFGITEDKAMTPLLMLSITGCPSVTVDSVAQPA